MPKRYAQYRLDSAEKTDEGFLRAPIFITRPGVFTYRMPDGSERKEFRSPTEVFEKESIASLKNKPVTREHPDTLIDSTNAKDNVVGVLTSTPKQQDGFIVDEVLVWDLRTIEEIENGERDKTSGGYTCDIVESEGVFEGESYQYEQRAIRYNHVATTVMGRAGPDSRIRLDSDDAMEIGIESVSKTVQINKKSRKDNCIMEFEIDRMKFANVDANLAMFLQNKFRVDSQSMDDLKKEIKSLKDKVKAQQTEKDEVTAKFDAISSDYNKLKETKMDSTKAREMVKERIKLEKIAESAGVEKFDTLDDNQIKLAVIEKDSPDFDTKGKSDDYINSRFDYISEKFDSDDNSLSNFHKSSSKTTFKNRSRGDSDNDSEKTRMKVQKADSEAYLKPLSTSSNRRG